MTQEAKRVSYKKGKTYEEIYGKERALELKNKLRKYHSGKILSKQHKENISKAHLGKKNYFYGKSHSEESKKKMRESLIGREVWNKGTHLSSRGMLNKSHTRETKIILSNRAKSRTGKDAPNWQGGLSFEQYDKTFNNKFKRAIRKRDNQVCMLCGIHREKLNRALDIHHVNYNKKLTVPQNCISLCGSCHVKTNFNRKHWRKMLQSILSEKYGYQYSQNEIVMEIKNGF